MFAESRYARAVLALPQRFRHAVGSFYDRLRVTFYSCSLDLHVKKNPVFFLPIVLSALLEFCKSRKPHNDFSYATQHTAEADCVSARMWAIPGFICRSCFRGSQYEPSGRLQGLMHILFRMHALRNAWRNSPCIKLLGFRTSARTVRIPSLRKRSLGPQPVDRNAQTDVVSQMQTEIVGENEP